MRIGLLLTFLLLLSACGPDETTGCLGDEEEDIDNDRDGFCVPVDCDDAVGTTFPGAEELCNDVDDNCNGRLPDEEATDADGDGEPLCRDCDDRDAAVGPHVTEACDGRDTDCDGSVPLDEGDSDGDGALDCLDCAPLDDSRPRPEEACSGVDDDCDGQLHPDESDGDEDGVTACDGDCDGADATVFPGAPELCDGLDNDCLAGVPADETDDDGDGFAECEGDCQDGEGGAAIGPTQPEICDGLDTDCDGALGADEATDVDGDGWAPCLGDCDDADTDRHPGTYEHAGVDVDFNCDGLTGATAAVIPRDDSETVLAAEMDALCTLHGRSLQVQDFELGSDGGPVSLSTVAAVGIWDGPEFGFSFVELVNNFVARSGVLFIQPNEVGESFTFRFDVPQDFVAFAVAGRDLGNWDGYGVTLLNGEDELDSAPLFGSDQPAVEGWEFRGYESAANIAFDAIRIDVATAPESLFFDDLYLCH